MKPANPYNGQKPFIFISYAHKDSDTVWPIIERMINDGYHVWYDDGIDPGTEWDEFIASKIKSSGFFIAFVSDNYLVSNNCKDELNYARDYVERRLLVYLEDANLPDGMEMRLARIQAIFRYKFSDENYFFDKLYSTKDLYLFKETTTDSPSVSSEKETEDEPLEEVASALNETPSSEGRSRFKELRWWEIVLFIISIIFIVAEVYYCTH